MGEQNGKATDGLTGSRDFGVTLVALRQGEVNHDASAELTKLLGQLRKHSNAFGKAKGKFTLTLEIEVQRDSEAVTIVADIASKAPKSKQPEGILWLRDDDSLATKQRQMPLNMRDVSADQQTRDVADVRVKGA